MNSLAEIPSSEEDSEEDSDRPLGFVRRYFSVSWIGYFDLVFNNFVISIKHIFLIFFSHLKMVLVLMVSWKTR